MIMGGGSSTSPTFTSSGVEIMAFSITYVVLVWSMVAATASGEASQESDRIINLPGQPSTIPSNNLSHFSGYITVNQENGRALFYWFFEAQSPQPLHKPLLLWLNGGPGCSSIGYGAAVELGPLKVGKANISFNEYAWNAESNLLFVESPVGVGFSYTNTSTDLNKLDDAFVAEDAYNFLVNWLQRFPQYKSHDFFISGESYAGHYVPQLADLIYDRNKDTTKYSFINLKGFIVGNPETDDYYDYNGLLEYAWTHSVIPDHLYQKAKQVCDFKLANWTDECNGAMEKVFDEYSEIDIYNIYAPKCLTTSTASSSAGTQSLLKVNDHDGLRRKTRIPGGYDPCYSVYAEQYFNREDVRASLHATVKQTGNWKTCSDSILGTYIFNVPSILPIYDKLIKGGLKIWIYSGDADGRVPFTGSRNCVQSLKLGLVSAWESWYHKKQVGGRMIEYNQGLTFITIRGAGHLVPLNKPSEALALITSFLTGKPLPKQRESS